MNHVEREFTTGPTGLKREPWTVKVAVWSARHRWPVLAAWFVLTIGLMLGSVALGGQRAESILDKGKTIGDSQTGTNAFNDAALPDQPALGTPLSPSQLGAAALSPGRAKFFAL